MSRRWSIVLAAYALAIVGVIYALSLVPAFREIFVAVRYRDDILATVVRMGSFFAPLSSQDNLADEMRPWTWLPQLVFVGSLAVTVYLAGRTVSASTGSGRIGLLLTGAVMLAGGLADVTGRAIATLRYMSLNYQDSELLTALELSLYEVNGLWEPEALILSIWLGIYMGLFAIVSRQLKRWTLANNWTLGSTGSDSSTGTVDPISISAGSCDPRVRDTSGLAAKLATLGTIPVLAASLAGGMNLYSSYPQYSGALDLRRSFANDVLADVVFYLKFRSSPPITGSFGYTESYGYVAPGKWLFSVAIAVIFVALLWIALRSVVGNFGVTPTIPGLAVVMTAWGTTILVGVLVGVLEDAIGSVPAQLVDLRLDFLSYDGDLALFDGMLFGTLWGWLVGLMVLFGYKRTRIPTAAHP